MSALNIISEVASHGGMQGVFSHASEACKCDMTFSVFVPPQATTGLRPVLWYLSGLTCTHANVMEKGEYRRLASELGLIVVCPDTSPRGNAVPDELTNWQMGKGAGFYLATAPKSNAVYTAFKAATRAAKQNGSLLPPKHILNATTKLMSSEGYGDGYRYDHDQPDAFPGQDYFPEKMGRQQFYTPPERGFDREINKRLQ